MHGESYPQHKAEIAQSAERALGKGKVTGSTPVLGSKAKETIRKLIEMNRKR